MNGTHLLRTITGDTWVDNAAHRLHHDGSCLPCNRDVEALGIWQGQALLLSSDTDCLSLWDGDGIIRALRIGVYPQDMAIADNTVYICGGADGQLHMASLPDLMKLSTFSLPGMPERIALHNQTAYVLTLLTDPEVHTALVSVDLASGVCRKVICCEGLPGALWADAGGLWLAAGCQLMHLSWNGSKPDCIISGFGLIRRLLPHDGGVVAIDPLEERAAWITATPLPAIVPLSCCASDFTLLIP